MRVVAGTAGGRRLVTPRGMDIRPTSDKVKESMFSILIGVIGSVEGCRVLDIFAGTGNLGIEALSRGASSAVFVDSGRQAGSIIPKNLQLTGFTDKGRLVAKDFRSALSMLESLSERFDLVFLDPPYKKGLLEQCLERLGSSRILGDDALVVAEYSSKEEPGSEFGTLHRFDNRVYGDTALAFFTKIKKGSS